MLREELVHIFCISVDKSHRRLLKSKNVIIEVLDVIGIHQVLDSVGGTLMGQGSSNPSQGSVYRPSHMDLVEFIRQCDPHKVSVWGKTRH